VGEGELSDLARTGREEQDFQIDDLEPSAHYEIVASLLYRKVDQFLINFLLGEDSGLTAPIIEMTRTRARVSVGTATSATDVATPVEAAGL
jgi:hypothetical protein